MTVESVEYGCAWSYWALPLFVSLGRWYGYKPKRAGVQVHIALLCFWLTVQVITS